jgi:hypothetical protein
LFSLDASLIDVRVFISLEINTYPWHIRRSSNLGHVFRGKGASCRPGNTVHINLFTLLQFECYGGNFYRTHAY